MNRRSSIKNIGLLGILGVSSFSIFKLMENGNTIAIHELDRYKPLVAELADIIIPRTDTPGARDAKVEEFIILMIKDSVNHKDQINFLNGLFDLKEYTVSNYDSEFQGCSLADKIAIMKHFERLDTGSNRFIRKAREILLGTSFFTLLKGLTVEGFCTSEIGATQALAYDYLPGNYQSCVKLRAGQKSWATK